MKLYISQSDIDAGEPCMASKCAMALAFTRATGLQCQTSCDGVWVYSNPRVHGDMSSEGSRFISLFDMDRKFCSPVVVELFFEKDAPAELQKDYVPSTELADQITRKVIPGRALPKAEYSHSL